MALRQFAVFMNAGSYVISPKSSGDALIWRRSIARIVPSWTGSSYFFPVRLSTVQMVSAIGFRISAVRLQIAVFVRLVLVVDRFGGDAVRAVGPAGEVLQLAPLAAERPPGFFHGMTPAEDTERLRHQGYSTHPGRGATCEGASRLRRRGDGRPWPAP